MEKQELAALQKENEEMRVVINRLNAANKEQSSIIAQLKIDLNDAQNRVRDLAKQFDMMNNQQMR